MAVKRKRLIRGRNPQPRRSRKGARLFKARVEKGLSLPALAQQLGLSTATVRRAEVDPKTVSKATLARVADYLAVEL